eukprot:GFUD01033365.1.p1 GENE.GFUD01033365.1~~GFUD01033365.1.p1  ORF type:complete len:254 (-),score=60.77 GFUD01033365.1:4-765(-)
MNYLNLVSILPAVLETKREDVFSPVVLETRETQVLDYAGFAKYVMKSDPEETDDKNKIETENLLQKIDKLNDKNEYLSTNLIETNSHLLSIYKRIRNLENENKEIEKIKKENVFFYQKLKRVQDENIQLQKQSKDFNISQKTIEDEMIVMKHKFAKLDGLEDELMLMKNKLENFTNFENAVSSEIKTFCQTLPLYTQIGKTQTESHKITNVNPRKKLEFESLLIRFMLPSIMTVAAIVMNMYLYLSTNNKFPI